MTPTPTWRALGSFARNRAPVQMQSSGILGVERTESEPYMVLAAVLPLTKSEDEVPPLYKEYAQPARAVVKSEARNVEMMDAG